MLECTVAKFLADGWWCILSTIVLTRDLTPRLKAALRWLDLRAFLALSSTGIIADYTSQIHDFQSQLA